MTERFLSCDWGSSSLRVQLVDAATLSVLGRAETGRGTATVFECWNKEKTPGDARIAFYQSVLSEAISDLTREAGAPVNDIPVIVSGMASSTIGMAELPYTDLPFDLSRDSFVTKLFDATDRFPYPLLLISGLRSGHDVMRGEEIQLIGCASPANALEQLFILPGTHSKHVAIAGQTLTGFNTFMTGEFFDVLSKHSMLSRSIVKGTEMNEDDQAGFEAGVLDGVKYNLLNAAFHVRTNQLFNIRSQEQNYFYLSGILIGSELRDLHDKKMHVTLVGNEKMNRLYAIALRKLNFSEIHTFSAADAVTRGHYLMWKRYFSN